MNLADLQEARYKSGETDSRKIRFSGKEKFMNSRDVQHVFSKANIISTKEEGHRRRILITVDATTDEALKIDHNLRAIADQIDQLDARDHHTSHKYNYYGYELEDIHSAAEDRWYPSGPPWIE